MGAQQKIGSGDIEAGKDEQASALLRLWGSTPWLKPVDKQYHRARVFKSGNSLAVRIPAGTKLAAGMELNLTIEDGIFLLMEPIEAPTRKFNIAKVAGSATNLNFINDEDRRLDDRALLWDRPQPDIEA